MFAKALTNLTLSNSIADAVFPNIAADRMLDDHSFTATLRACIGSRSENGKALVCLSSSSYRIDVIQDKRLRSLIETKIEEFRPDVLYIHQCTHPHADNVNEFFNLLDDANDGFVNTYPGYVELKNIRDFVAGTLKARFYTNVEARSTVIFTDCMNYRKWHLIQSFIPRYFPWFFKDKPITDDEKRLLLSLTKRNSEDYELLIEEFSERLGMRDRFIESALGDLEIRSRKIQLDDLYDTISSTRNQMQTILDQYTAMCERLDDLNIRYTGLNEIINKKTVETELVDYFKSRNNLDLVGTHGNRFSFIIRTYLDSWDPDIFDTSVRNSDSSLFVGYDVDNEDFVPREKREKFFKAIFGDNPVLRIKICAFFELNLSGRAQSSAGYHYPPKYKGYMPNPHLFFYNCLGNHDRFICEALSKGDTVGAIEQCFSSAKSINLAESMTYCRFFESLFNRRVGSVIELPNGESVTPSEALNWLEAQEQTEDQEV